MDVRVTADTFDAGAELNAFTAKQDGAGAIVSFTGIVRDVADGLRHMEIEHYPGMTAKAIEAICQDALARWALLDILVIHRHGKLIATDQIMMVATSSAHRADAFAAADFLMDYLKSRAPFWKKEATQKGDEWVDAKEADEQALDRWSTS